MRIAVADPSRTVCRIVKDLLESWGHEVLAYDDAPQALEGILGDEDIRALITTAELASGSGAHLAREARLLVGNDRPLYIIVMSCARQREKLIEALDNGADDFISKPPAPEELKARLRAADRVTGMQAELIHIATTDVLTGLLTRRAFFERAARMINEKAGVQPASALICDIDLFKSINDTYGHEAGDAVLRAVAAEARKLQGIVGRIGGEEFAVLIDKPLTEAAAIAETFRQDVAKLATSVGKNRIAVTCSIGVSEFHKGDTLDDVLRHADIALYRAKHSGRNRVVIATDGTASGSLLGFRAVTRQQREEPLGGPPK